MQTKIPKLQLAQRGWPEVLQSAQNLLAGSLRRVLRICWLRSVVILRWALEEVAAEPPVLREEYDMVRGGNKEYTRDWNQKEIKMYEIQKWNLVNDAR